MSPTQSSPTTSCPFCNRPFKRLSNHLPHCRERGDASYEHLLAAKTRRKLATALHPVKQRCDRCERSFKRLDMHLARSSRCKNITSATPMKDQAFSSQPPLPASMPDSPSSPGPPCGSLEQTPLTPESRATLLVPKRDEDWRKADEYFASTLVPM